MPGVCTQLVTVLTLWDVDAYVCQSIIMIHVDMAMSLRHHARQRLWITHLPVTMGGGPRVVVSTAAFHVRAWGSVPGLGGLKEAKMFLSHPLVQLSIVGSLRDRDRPRTSRVSILLQFKSLILNIHIYILSRIYIFGIILIEDFIFSRRLFLEDRNEKKFQHMAFCYLRKKILPPHRFTQK